MPGYGRQLITSNTVLPTRVSADGNPKYKAGGITIDQTTIPAASGSDTTLPDGSVIKANFQYLRYGQIMTMITTQEIQTLTITGTPTGGTFKLSYQGQPTTAIAYNANAATVLAAVQAISGLSSSIVTAAGGGALPGTPVTLTWALGYGPGGNPDSLAVYDNSLTGGTSPSLAITTGTSGASGGKYGPYDSAASDGRQTLTRSRCFILDETYLLYPNGLGLPAANDVIGGVFEGGDAWFDRILMTSGSHSLTAGPTVTEFEAAFPRISYYRQD